MKKLSMMSTDIVDENIQKIAKLFPNCLTERKDENGRLVPAIDFDQLRQELSHDLVEGSEERYRFEWPDKRNAIRLANEPITDTLRPCRKDSVNFDTTENLYIEGNNLEVLKLLREDYLGGIKMVYIDPPYNTGKDFVYSDNFTIDAETYAEMSHMRDEDGNYLVDASARNTEANGRFHTDWLNMMYPRLKVAKDLLKDDGVIFISIDDNELENLRKICDEIFGARNFVACCVRKRRDSQANLAKNISPIHEYVVIYAKNNTGEVLNKVAANIDEKDFRNPDNDPRGPYKTMPCTNKGGAVYTVTTPNGGEITEEWRFKRETYDALLADNRLVFPRGGDGKPRYKLFLSEKKKEGQLANTWLDNLASNQAATREIKDLFDDKLPFDTPKPIGLLKFCIELGSKDGDYILDFFSGSATTAHAVMELNAEIGGNRKFIMVQLPEETETTSAAYKCGFTNICQIGKHRIRKAGERIIEKLKNEQPSLFGGSGDKKLPDVGFRVLRLDSSNMQQVYYTPDKVTEQTLFEDNIKPDRTDEDLLFQAMLSLGIELSDKIEETEIAGKKVWSVSDGYLMACFDDDVNETTITEIAKLQPTYFVTRDKSMASDNVADNFEQILKEYSPSTSYRIL